MKFLNKYKDSIKKIEGVSTSSAPPHYWTTSGNYCVNRILTGNFDRAVGQGRVLGLVGPSGCLPEGETVSIYVMKTVPAITETHEE